MYRSRFLTLLWLLLATAFSPLVVAEPFFYPSQAKASFKLEIPDGWKLEKLPEERFAITSPSGAVKATLITTRGNKDQALNVLVAETEITLKYDAKEAAAWSGGFRPIKLNNLRIATQLKAKGKRPADGKPIVLDFVIFSPDRQQWALLQAVYLVDTPRPEQEAFLKLVGSITAG
jgi:hypothetical protein